jgi:hypothetical protein
MSEQYKIIGKGKRGWHAQSSECSSDGATLEKYAKEAAENCLVYDAKDVEYSLFVQFICHGPMVDTNLPENTVDRFTEQDREAAKRMRPGLSGGFETIAKVAIENERYTGLDKVSLDIYEKMLRKLPGMKIGHVVNGTVIWE